MSLPTIQNLTHISLGDYHLIFAVILILKHATFLLLSNMSPESALTHAEVDYREAKIDSRIRQYLTAPSQEHSVESFADFIIATDMTCATLHDNGTPKYVPNLKLYRYANAIVCTRSIREFNKGEGMQTEGQAQVIWRQLFISTCSDTVDGTPRMTASYVSDESPRSDAIALQLLEIFGGNASVTDYPMSSGVDNKRRQNEYDQIMHMSLRNWVPFVHHTISVPHSHSSLACQIKYQLAGAPSRAAVTKSSAKTAKVSRLRDSQDRGNGGSILLAFNASFPDILIPGRTNGTRQGIYHGEITRNTLLALDDAAPQLILFDLNRHYGLEKEALGLVESACSGRDGSDEDDAYRGSRGGPGEALMCSYVSGIGNDAGPAEASAVGGASRMLSASIEELALMYLFVCVDSLYRHCPGFEECMREALRILLGDEVVKRVEMDLAEDGSSVGSATSLESS
ncbi:hypothetical protein EDB92DRAFT_2105356 [Lactarius akahatsu]|uniref:Hexokinase C-terminal domain-containing protein n=1 Tax=Lactarius akahatsu TaxID=416441 RepID=A0AAD4LC85_9AGAM|nr:hypothetical protein EDB92DRAFT_2105356 [Lactarius akahatsu]